MNHYNSKQFINLIREECKNKGFTFKEDKTLRINKNAAYAIFRRGTGERLSGSETLNHWKSAYFNQCAFDGLSS